MSGAARHWEQDKDSTLYVGNLAEEVTDAQVWELFLQCGPVVNVHLPKDRVSQNHQGFGFVEFAGEEDADYACKIMNQIRLYSKPIRVNKASADRRTNPDGTIATSSSVGAELFVGNLDSMVDERVLYDTFQRFGPLLQPPKVTRDDSNLSKGYGFVSYATFESSDDAIANMHGQYLMNKEITVQYAFKKDGKGERHGDAAERALATQAVRNGIEMQIPAMPAALAMPQQTIPVMPNGLGYGGPVHPPAMQYGYAPGPVQLNGYAPSPVQLNGYAPSPLQPNGYPPSSVQPNGFAPPRQFDNTPLQAPGLGAGLPARPPVSNAGYGGPPGMPGVPPGYPPGYAPPGVYNRPPGQ